MGNKELMQNSTIDTEGREIAEDGIGLEGDEARETVVELDDKFKVIEEGEVIDDIKFTNHLDFLKPVQLPEKHSEADEIEINDVYLFNGHKWIITGNDTAAMPTQVGSSKTDQNLLEIDSLAVLDFIEDLKPKEILRFDGPVGSRQPSDFLDDFKPSDIPRIGELKLETKSKDIESENNDKTWKATSEKDFINESDLSQTVLPDLLESSNLIVYSSSSDTSSNDEKVEQIPNTPLEAGWVFIESGWNNVNSNTPSTDEEKLNEQATQNVFQVINTGPEFEPILEEEHSAEEQQSEDLTSEHQLSEEHTEAGLQESIIDQIEKLLFLDELKPHTIPSIYEVMLPANEFVSDHLTRMKPENHPILRENPEDSKLESGWMFSNKNWIKWDESDECNGTPRQVDNLITASDDPFGQSIATFNDFSFQADFLSNFKPEGIPRIEERKVEQTQSKILEMPAPELELSQTNEFVCVMTYDADNGQIVCGMPISKRELDEQVAVSISAEVDESEENPNPDSNQSDPVENDSETCAEGGSSTVADNSGDGSNTQLVVDNSSIKEENTTDTNTEKDQNNEANESDIKSDGKRLINSNEKGQENKTEKSAKLKTVLRQPAGLVLPGPNDIWVNGQVLRDGHVIMESCWEEVVESDETDAKPFSVEEEFNLIVLETEKSDNQTQEELQEQQKDIEKDPKSVEKPEPEDSSLNVETLSTETTTNIVSEISEKFKVILQKPAGLILPGPNDIWVNGQVLRDGVVIMESCWEEGVSNIEDAPAVAPSTSATNNDESTKSSKIDDPVSNTVQPGSDCNEERQIDSESEPNLGTEAIKSDTEEAETNEPETVQIVCDRGRRHFENLALERATISSEEANQNTTTPPPTNTDSPTTPQRYKSELFHNLLPKTPPAVVKVSEPDLTEPDQIPEVVEDVTTNPPGTTNHASNDTNNAPNPIIASHSIAENNPPDTVLEEPIAEESFTNAKEENVDENNNSSEEHMIPGKYFFSDTVCNLIAVVSTIKSAHRFHISTQVR